MRRRCAAPASRGFRIGAQSLDRRGAAAAGPAPSRPATSPTPSPRRAAAGSGRSTSTCSTTSRRTVATWMATLDAALDLEPDHLSLYALTLDDPDAEGLTGPGGDHLPTTRGARRWRDVARPGPGRGPGRRPVPPRGRRWPRPGWRGYEISNWARPGHESRHNLAYWQRRPYEAVGPGSARVRRRDPALERGSARRLRRGAGPADRRGRGCRRAARSARLRRGRAEADDPRAPRSTPASPLPRRTSRRSPTSSAGRSRPSSSRSPPDDRIVLTTRGRLLSNELFARLV